MPRIDENLSLVVQVNDAAYVHATPISRTAFEAHFRLLASTHADLFGRGGNYARVAPLVATLTLKDVGKREAEDRGQQGDGGAASLLAEIRRLSTVAAATSKGWEFISVDAAIQRSVFGQEDWLEVESAIVFFTCLWWISHRRQAAETAKLLSSAIGLSTTPLPPSEWINSLPRSTPAETSPEAPEAPKGFAPLSSIPS